MILTCITNFVTDAPVASTPASRAELVLNQFKEVIIESCESFPARTFFVCPPMFRSRPVWYREGLSEVLQKFSALMSSEVPQNLVLMPSFPSPDFEVDGVHLTPYSGLEYVVHLFESAHALISKQGSDVSSKVALGSESTRLLEDRMVAVEQCQKLLCKSLESKTAVDCELACFQENVRNEVFFVISGLPRLPAGLLGRDWQDRAKADVQGVIKTLLGKELPIIVVQNVSGRGADAETRYNVKMECAAHSQEIRSKFGYFFTRGVDTRPPTLSKISIGNRLTPASQIRIAILKLLAKRYVKSNPEGKAKVISYEARPMLKITPPSGTSDSRVKNFTYIEAIRKLPVNFTAKELRPILIKAGKRFTNRLRSTFVVLDDDMKIPAEDEDAESIPEVDADVDDEDRVLVQVQSGTSGRGQKRGNAAPAGNKNKSKVRY